MNEVHALNITFFWQNNKDTEVRESGKVRRNFWQFYTGEGRRRARGYKPGRSWTV